ncbi:MAG TPA: hypothetical protein PLD47_04550 [Aggregatilineales bacterium]|nr:hypothetical protein [Anaerolineales bacterium]HRE46973.1 hypothetical protein [Aggregatilineales bacterium]
MPIVPPLRWRDGGGWLILRSYGDLNDPITLDLDTQTLTKIARGEPLAYLWAGGDIEDADTHLDLLEDLGAPTGYLVDLLTEDDETITAQLKDAGLIILGDGDERTLRSALVGAAEAALMTAFRREGVILGIGAGARVLGSLLLTHGAGLGWVAGACILTDYDLTSAGDMAAVLLNNPGTYGIGIGAGAGLVLGGDGQIEVWGTGKVTVTLGGNPK